MRLRSTDLASVAMTATAFALWANLADLDRPGYVSVVLALGGVLACLAAHEVRRSDALGWLVTTGHALTTVFALVVVCGTGLPGVAPGGWETSTVIAVATATTALLAGLVGLASTHHGRRGPGREV